jgi:uncharacterized phage protein (TIGR02218 family)
MRTLSASWEAMLATRQHYRATCVLIETRAGDSFGLTTHDVALSIDIGELYDPVTYDPRGMLPSEVVLSSGFEASNFEIRGPLGAIYTEANVIGGRFNRATVKLFQVKWNELIAGNLEILKGDITECRVEDDEFIFEVRSIQDRFNQTIGRTTSPYCPYDFGDSRCTVEKTDYPGTITAVISDLQLEVDLPGGGGQNFFQHGELLFSTGQLAGNPPVAIISSITSGLITLFEPLIDLPAEGDSIIVHRGCSKLRISYDNPELPTCMTYLNAINFGGEDAMPGTDQALKYPVPGQPGA